MTYKKYLPALTMIMLFGCASTTPPAYQKNKAPEDRDEYIGAKGATQYLKDQTYIAKKEQQEACNNARIDLAVAESKQDKNEIERQKNLIEQYCL